ncbi:ATP-grasp domain-containing protein [Crocosphaera sp. UHCC 0190]|uniref:ATP-grasp domain-containing protein n=1 Tax=Crocosphaera sp. UHCC 0190 TaxID=3110246 RepID=UPI002B1F38A3|nr:ATP-grasp domain-containing protein [Crocosphaera sp. UHCC 0190]MEA5510749.1 ATP-grasp domain-containing protein [Crocosphaera sp. UHCC 0190]
MDLLEYQAKELFHQVGIPILPSQPIANLSELKHLHIPYPVVLKSQVHSGGRGRAGGIRFVQNTIDAVAAAQAIFSLPILGEYPEVILAEARYDAQEEFFLSILLDYQLQRPVLLGSSRGGIDVETLLKHMHKVVLDQDFSPFYARRLATQMGLKGRLIHGVSAIVEKMYQLFVEKDLDLVEINPLAVSAAGEVMALDGKITVNDTALSRHLDLLSLATPNGENKSNLSPVQMMVQTPSQKPRWVGTSQGEGNVGIICNSWGLTLTTWDLLVHQKSKPACAFVIEEKGSTKSLVKQLGIALEKMLKMPELQVVLINILGNGSTSEMAAQVIADYCQPFVNQQNSEDRLPRPTGTNVPRKRGKPTPTKAEPFQLVIRLIGGNLDKIQETVTFLPIYWLEDLKSAVEKTATLAGSKG